MSENDSRSPHGRDRHRRAGVALARVMITATSGSRIAR